MPRFSANLGFLWQELSLPERIGAAAAAGFEAVECHVPFDFSSDEIASVLADTGLQMVSLNTAMGPNGPEDFGLVARPGRQDEARALIDQAVDFAAAVGAEGVNVLAGRTAREPGAEEVYRSNLAYAIERAAPLGVILLLEPISTKAVPDYHLSLVDQGVDTIRSVAAKVGKPAEEIPLKILFDCFHVQTMQGNLVERLATNLDLIGHIQIAAVPDRGAPDHGEIDYTWLFAEIDRLGYSGWVGAEYHPDAGAHQPGATEASLGWFVDHRRPTAGDAT